MRENRQAAGGRSRARNPEKSRLLCCQHRDGKPPKVPNMHTVSQGAMDPERARYAASLPPFLQTSAGEPASGRGPQATRGGESATGAQRREDGGDGTSPADFRGERCPDIPVWAMDQTNEVAKTPLRSSYSLLRAFSESRKGETRGRCFMASGGHFAPSGGLVLRGRGSRRSRGNPRRGCPSPLRRS